MRFAIAYSKLDPAGINIVERLKETGFLPHMPIIELSKESIFSDDLNEKNYPELRNIDFIVFATKHRSEKGNPSLSVHAPGNWRTAEFGGKSGKACKTSAFVIKYLFQNLNKIYSENKESLDRPYEITLEVTHHGPLIDLPCCFIELGSSENEWGDKSAAKIIAKTIFSLENYDPPSSWIASIGIGGPHYCPNFNKIQLNTNYALSHIISEYSFPITELILKEAEEKTIENLKEVLIDWKGMGKSEEKEKILELLKRLGYKYTRTTSASKDTV